MRCQITTETQPSHWPSAKFRRALARAYGAVLIAARPIAAFATGPLQQAGLKISSKPIWKLGAAH